MVGRRWHERGRRRLRAVVTAVRVLRHLFAPSARHSFPEDALQRITAAIDDSELRHRGEICFAVEAALPVRAVLAGLDARARAEEVFAQLRLWDTEANSGVLIYLLLADHRIELVADRGLAAHIEDAQWQGVCRQIEDGLRAGQPEAAVRRGIDGVTALLVRHLPRIEGVADANELPNRPHVL